MLTPDTSEISGPIEGGTYAAEITAAEPGVSKTGGSKVVLKFGVTVGEKTVPRQVHMPVTGAGAFGFDALLRACHFDEAANKFKDKSLSAAEKEFDEQQLVGQKLFVVIEPDTYNGQLTDKITGYLRA